MGLGDWSLLDTWIVITAALASAACALPGTFLVLKRQSLMGDALSHATLPGIVLAFLGLEQARQAGWITEDTLLAIRPFVLFTGAAGTGILCGVMTEVVTRWGRVEPSAALGVVFTSLFAFGLLLVRMSADSAHIDAGCVLYGNLETIITDTIGRTGIPRAAVVNACVLAVNVFLLVLFYKPLKVCTFDPGLAHSLGISTATVQLALLAATGATVVAAFESVGSILVLAMLVVPPATALLISNRLSGVLSVAVGLGVAIAVLGHVSALIVPPLLRALLGWRELGDASTSGMMAVVAGLTFVVGWLGAPRSGVIRQLIDQRRLQARIHREDVLGVLYRLEELRHASGATMTRTDLLAALQMARGTLSRTMRDLARRGLLTQSPEGITLTSQGSDRARQVVRSHRLWESYIATHFALDGSRLHVSAERAEHYLGPALQAQLADELDQPRIDPHGSAIPPANPVPDKSEEQQNVERPGQ